MAIQEVIRFDWAMKYILRDKANFDVLEAFLSSLLKEDIIVEELLESESNKESREQKINRVDLKCKDSQGKQIIIEIQNEREAGYIHRLLWGTSKAIAESIGSGVDYSKIAKVISISILHYTMSVDERVNKDFIYHGTTEMMGLHIKEPFILYNKAPAITCKNIFPEYYLIYSDRFESEPIEDIEEWVYFFKHGKIRDDFKSPGILLAAKKLNFLRMNKEEKDAYIKYMDNIVRDRDVFETAINDSLKKERIRIAKEAIQEGFNDVQIQKLTKLTLDEIVKIREELEQME